MPTEESVVLDKEEVSLQMLSKIGLQSIKVRFLPAKIAYENYLSGRQLDISPGAVRLRRVGHMILGSKGVAFSDENRKILRFTGGLLLRQQKQQK